LKHERIARAQHIVDVRKERVDGKLDQLVRGKGHE